jgi:uncharacterized protein (TIGR02588 family)
VTERAGKTKRPPTLEWIAGAGGALIFAAMVAVLIATGMSADAPPSISVTTERIQAVENGFVLQFVARNDGGATAAAVDIVAELRTGETAEERRSHFDYLPPHSERRGGVFFDSDPRQGDLSLRAEGYNEP